MPPDLNHAIERAERDAFRAPVPPRYTISARSVQLKIPLNPTEVLALFAPEGRQRIKFIVAYNDGSLRADVALKALRRAQAIIRAMGPENSFVMLQGKLGRGEVLECGLVVQAKATAPAGG
jgi:hypothetical protein